MQNLAVIVIPIHRNFLDKYEKVSLLRCLEVFKNYPIVLIAPEGLEISVYEELGQKEVIFFEKQYFESVKGYSKLLTRPFFYKTFRQYDYMLIYQLDVFVFRDELAYWCSQNYDYIGAPWIDDTWIKALSKKWKVPFLSNFFHRVGNGGFSLRKVSSFSWASQIFSPFTAHMKLNEDIIWSNNPFSFTPLFKIPPFELALRFAFEEQPQKCFDLTEQKLPFACHAWQKHESRFWVSHFANLGYDISFVLN